MANTLKRFFTEKPQTRADFLLVWISATIVPFVVIPTVGFFKGDVAQTVADNWVMFIVAPVVTGLVLWPYMRKRAQENAE